MDEMQRDVARFRAEKRITGMMKYALDIVAELRAQQDRQTDKLGESLSEMETFIFDQSGIEIDLAHLAKHAEFLDDAQQTILRKKILDFGGELRREL